MIRMFVSTHVNVPMPMQSYFLPLQLGSAEKQPWDGYVSDNTGDHISEKNRHFGELTGLYWVWKNTQDQKIGWCHYRRFFSPILFPPENYKGVTVDRGVAQAIINFGQDGALFDVELNLTDMIVPTKIPVSPKEFYCRVHRECDWDDMMRGIADLYPDEHAEAERYFGHEQGTHFWCMFMAQRPLFDQYCQWLFPLLFHLETIIAPPQDTVRSRVFAFLAEHLFPYWTASRGVRLVQRPIIFINQNPA